jgi:hypothetical protein
MVGSMSEFELLFAPHEQAWVDLRFRLACVAREIHFFAFSGEAINICTLLAISEYFAELAMSIPMAPIPSQDRAPVHASTLFAAQVLQFVRPDGTEAGVDERR